MEYFAVQKILQNQELAEVYKVDIPEDSRSRDMMVLYCEVAPFDHARVIANYCWKVIRLKNNLQEYESMHALRFLIEAFRGRKECLEDFYEEFKSFIFSEIRPDNHIFSVKYATEALSILKKEDLEEGAIRCYEIKNSWVDEVVLRGTRHLENAGENLIAFSFIRFLPSSQQYIEALATFFFPGAQSLSQIKKFQSEVLFSLSLSECFKPIHRLIKTKYRIIVFRFFLFSFIYFLTIAFFLIKYYKINQSYTLSSFIQYTHLYSPTFVIFLSFLIILIKSIEELFLIVYFYNIKYFKMVYFNEFLFFWRRKKYIVLSIVIFVSIFIFFIFAGYNNQGMIGRILIFLKNIMLIVFGILILFSIFFVIKEIYDFINNYIFFNKQYSKIKSTREEIYNLYFKLIPYFQNKFINYLENHMTEITGEWPDETFLNADQGHVRLAKLEEKWRGLAK